MLGEADREQLTRLRWIWDKQYEINTNGETWTATPHRDPETALTEPTQKALWLAIQDDNAKRKAAAGTPEGYWVETASGPPYHVRPPQLPPRFRNSGA